MCASSKSLYVIACHGIITYIGIIGVVLVIGPSALHSIECPFLVCFVCWICVPILVSIHMVDMLDLYNIPWPKAPWVVFEVHVLRMQPLCRWPVF